MESNIVLGERTESNNIKVDETAPIQTFDGGAIRSSKQEKNRYDLIPGDVMKMVITEMRRAGGYLRTNDNDVFDLYECIYDENYADAIVILTIMGYGEDDCPTSIAFERMQDALAWHYKYGADIYGEDNWKHGIPKSSFISSGIRHTHQFITGETDEPHLISAIWNFCGALWLELNGDE